MTRLLPLCALIASSTGLLAGSPSGPAADRGQADIAWIHDVVMNLCPARTFTKTWDDEKRLKLAEDFDPDSIDFWGGMTMNPGNIYRNRGIAITVNQANEYDAHILDTASHWDYFYQNGISVQEDGSLGRYVDEVYNGEYGANPASERWNHMVGQHMFRMTDYADVYFQDNICNPLSVLGMGFEDSLNARFVEHLKKNFPGDKLRSLGLTTLDGFNIRNAVAAARKRLNVPSSGSQVPQERAETLIRDPLMHEFIRFSTILQVNVWRDFVKNARDYSLERGRPVMAYEGNQAGITGKRVLATLQSQTSDIVWIEAAVMLQPSLGGARQAESTVYYKVGNASGLHKKPVRIVQYPDARFSEDVRMPFIIYGAEAYANGAVPVWAYTFSLHNKGNLDVPIYQPLKDFAQFVNARRELFVDRENVADTAMVLSMPSLFWRQFSSLSTDSPHYKNFTSVARLLEDHHRPWEALVFGYPEVFDDTEVLTRLKRYRMIILPNVDAISANQVAALSDFVRGGGTLALWGPCGDNDEQLIPRPANAFAPLAANPGKGRVITVSQAEAKGYLELSRYLLPLGQKEESIWRYTFEEPGADWTQPSFDDQKWQQGATPIASVKQYGKRAKTDWPGPAIWMRKEVQLEEVPQEPVIHFSQQGVKVMWVGAEMEVPGDGFEVFINGVFAGSSKTRWSGIHSLPVSMEARKAMVRGRNVITVRSQQSNDPRQFVDMGLAEFSSDTALADKLQISNPMLETQGLDRDVWVNVFRHGNGPMHSVHILNYGLDFKKDQSYPQGPSTIRLRLGSETAARLTEARFEQLGERNAVNIPIKRLPDGALELQLPGVTTWGILTLQATGERDARKVAADIRKWRNRISLASRRHDDIAPTVAPLLQQADQKAYVPAGTTDFSPYVKDASPLAEVLRNRLASLTTELNAQPRLQPSAWLQATNAVRKFDFGKAGAAPGWTEINTGTRYLPKRGFGWTKQLTRTADYDQKGPDPLLQDFISPQSPAEYLVPLSINGNRYFPLSHPLVNPAILRVDLPNGDYVGALVTGSREVVGWHSDQVGIATTFLDVNGEPVLDGTPLRSGFWKTRAFPFRVTNGRAEFRFHGNAVGPYYHNAVEWLINALAIFKASEAPQDLRDQIAAREKNRKGLLQSWHLIGPFPDPNWNGLEVTYAAEKPVNLAAEYQGWWGRGAPVRWIKYQSGETFGAVPLEKYFDERQGSGSAAQGAVAFAYTRVWSPSDGNYQLFGGLSGSGLITVNGETAFHQPAALGLQEDEFRTSVSLRKGWNDILVKSLHRWNGAWKFHLGLLDAQRKPLPPPPKE